jgi:pimeloyl-ACP methyl ester carboxylesterase
MVVGPRRNGVFGGWTRAGNSRVFVRVPTRLKQRSAELNGFGANGDRPDLEGTPAVLVHGLSSSRSLRPLIKALGGRHPVFAPDLPGFGMTDQPIHPLDIRGLANALRRWMVENDLAPANLIGVSFGCQVAVEMAARHPTAVDRLALIGPGPDPAARSACQLALRWARNAPRSSPRLAPGLVHDFFDAGPWRSARSLQTALETRIERRLSAVEAPTLVVRPERDRLVPEKWAERVAELIPDAELVTVPKASHSIGPRTAARLTAVLDPFLAEIEAEDLIEELGQVNQIDEADDAAEVGTADETDAEEEALEPAP